MRTLASPTTPPLAVASSHLSRSPSQPHPDTQPQPNPLYLTLLSTHHHYVTATFLLLHHHRRHHLLLLFNLPRSGKFLLYNASEPPAMAGSSPSGQDHPAASPLECSPTVTIATAAASRRLPPPCWSHDETVALIDAYRDKWYSLRRGNLRASHWQEVADDVAARCPVIPPKTAVQCRHKMEKLRKRYRAEIQRAAPYGGSRSHRYCSAWVHFKRMDAMEKGPTTSAAAAADEEEEEEDQEDSHIKRIGDIYSNNNNRSSNSYNNTSNNRSMFHGSTANGGTGFRIRIPGRGGVGPSSAKVYSKFEMAAQNPNSYVNPGINYGSNKSTRDGFGGRGDMGKRVVGEEVKKGDPVAEMVAAIRMMGEGFVRMERMKMDMAREVEEMRMEMEMKRTEMILESQQRIVDAFAKAISERKSKKVRRTPNAEC